MSGLLNLPGAIISGVQNLFSPQAEPTPPAPAVTPPPPMPLPDDKSVQMQQRKSLAQLVKSRGRASTILTSDGSLGTPPQALGG